MPAIILLNKPDHLLPQVVDFLTEEWQGGLLDLSDTIFVLPTQESQRRLHEALVRTTAGRGAALLPPQWMLPMQLLEGNRTNFVPVSLEQILWMQMVIGMTPEESHLLFPRKTPRFDPSSATDFAASIHKLRGELAQAGMRLGEAAAKQGQDLRWKALASLESRYLEELSKLGFTDRISSQLEGIEHPELPPQIRHLVIAGTPDLPKVYESHIPAIEHQGIRVTVLIYDPQCMGRLFFDSLGRPNDRWSKLPIPIESESIHLCGDQSETTELASLLVEASGGKGTFCAIGVASTELAQLLEDALQTLKLPVFNPAGQALDSVPIGSLLHRLSHQFEEDSFQSFLQLLRHPDILRWLSLDPVRDLEALDALHEYLILSSLDDLLNRWPEHPIPRITIPETLQASLILVQQLLSSLRSGHGTAPLLEGLSRIYRSTDLTQTPGGKESVERIGLWAQGAEEMMLAKRTTDLLILLLSHLKSGIHTGEKQSHAIELPGWLELLWEDAPHLLIVGMNDGLIPETHRNDPFLHERLRCEWGLACDHSRLCRDSYLILSMMATRSEAVCGKENKGTKTGRIDFLFSRQDEAGAILKPSRLLLRPKTENELPALVQELFREVPPRPGEQWRSAWALKPERKVAPTTLSASSIKDYLACPTRFYLKHVLKLRKESFGAEEANGAVFGVLLHDTLRTFGTDPQLKNLHERHQIESALLSIWKDLFTSRFGSNLSLPLFYQLEAGVRRLRGAARAQSELRAQGWEIMACERSFNDFPISITGTSFLLRGQIDRIDRRVTAQGTEWRILDYKSSEQSKFPYQQHIQSVKKSECETRFAGYECVSIRDKQHRWIDLQLPLYKIVLSAELASGQSSYLHLDEITPGPVEVGYLSLPAKISATEFLPFVELDDLSTSAHDCLLGILQAIHEGIFWPPRQPKYDDFQGLFFDHLEAEARSGQQTLDPENLMPGGGA